MKFSSKFHYYLLKSYEIQCMCNLNWIFFDSVLQVLINSEKTRSVIAFAPGECQSEFHQSSEIQVWDIIIIHVYEQLDSALLIWHFVCFLFLHFIGFGNWTDLWVLENKKKLCYTAFLIQNDVFKIMWKHFIMRFGCSKNFFKRIYNFEIFLRTCICRFKYTFWL